MTSGLREGTRGASARAETVLVRAARMAGTSAEIAATARAINGDDDDGRHADRRRAGRTDQAGPCACEQGCDQPSCNQTGRGGTHSQRELLHQEHDRDRCRGGADGFEQAYSLRLLGHPQAGEDAETGEGEEAEQPSPDSQGHLLDPDQGVDRALDALPGKGAPERCWVSTKAGAWAGFASFRLRR